MSADSLIMCALGGVSILGLLAVLRRGINDPLVVLLGFYLFFAYGPVINFLLGEKIYFGIKTEYIPTASFIFLVAAFGLFLPLWFIPLNREKFKVSVTSVSELSAILQPANIVMGVFSLFLILKLLLSNGGFGSDKIRNINAIGVSLHYVYLLVELYLTAFFFSTGRTRIAKFGYFFNLFLYISYCLLIGERDFIFTFISLGVHWSIGQSGNRMLTIKLLLGAVLLVVLATGIFVLRDSTQVFSSPLVAIMNQGSLLFVNTFTLFLIDKGHSLFYGQSYLYALLNLIPSGIWSTGFNMPDWFRDQYAPGSSSGYGYGLDAEGFLNFGWVGVFLTFLMLGLLQRLVFNAKRARDLVMYLSVFSLAFTMYSLRNDSTAYLKGHVYALVSYASLYFLAKFFVRGESR